MPTLHALVATSVAAALLFGPLASSGQIGGGSQLGDNPTASTGTDPSNSASAASSAHAATNTSNSAAPSNASANGSASVSAAPANTSADSNTPESVPGQYIVTYDAGTSKTEAKDAISDAAHPTDRDVDRTTTLARRVVLTTFDGALDHGDQQHFERALRNTPGIASVEPNYLLKTQDYALSHDTDVAKLWNIESRSGANHGVNANVAWQAGLTGAGTTIAILDTGIIAHPDLTKNTIGGFDFVSTVSANKSNHSYGLSHDGNGWDSDPTDPGDYCNAKDVDAEDAVSSWHGSHVAGIAAATRDNNTAVAGVAPDARIEPVRVLGSCGTGTAADIIAGITWASGGTVSGAPANRFPATVINMSFGVELQRCKDTAMERAIAGAIGRGTSVVVAAGNDDLPLSYSTPANCNGVIDVTASTSTGDLAWYSNYGTYGRNLTVAAPGGGGWRYGSDAYPIYSTVDSSDGPLSTAANSYVVEGMEGTSMAAPHVAGLIALIKQQHPSYSPVRVASALRASVQSWSKVSGCTKSLCGAGVVSAASFVRHPLRLEFIATRKPVIHGAIKVGRRVSARTLAWKPSAAFTYRWRVNGHTVATGRNWTIPAKDVGKRLSLDAVGTRTGYVPFTLHSRSAKIAKGTFKTKAVHMVGQRKVGHVLTVHHGNWGAAATYQYRWYANGKRIKHASKARLKIVRHLRGERLSVKVIARAHGYKTAHRTSNKTAHIRR